MMPPPFENQKAFTLIEVLTVVLIVSLLFSLLLPVAGALLQQARYAKTCGNYRQIGAALQNYIADHDGSLPGPLTVAVFAYGRSEPLPTDGPSFGAYIAPYLVSSATGNTFQQHIGVLKCPLLSQRAQNNAKTANFITLDFMRSGPSDPVLNNWENNRFGEFGGATFDEARQKSHQPKRVAALSDIARRSPILSTADQKNWNSLDNALLPTNGVLRGKRVYMFLDGSAETSTNVAIYQR